MNIEITLHNVHLKAENLQSNHMTDAIQGFFYVLLLDGRPSLAISRQLNITS